MIERKSESHLIAIFERIAAEGAPPLKSHIYLLNYEQFFTPLREQPITLLELGVHQGKSLQLWRDYFADGLIVGLDCEPVELVDPTGRITIFQGLQQDIEVLDQLARETAPSGFDIIIDDASHVGGLTRTSFWHLFQHHLKPGGLYVIEDWRTGYWQAWPDGHEFEPPQRPINEDRGRWFSHSYGMVGLLKELIDELGMDAITNPARGAEGPQSFPQFEFLQLTPGQVFIKKSTPDLELLLSPPFG